MKSSIILKALILLLVSLILIPGVLSGEFKVECRNEGSELYSYSFRKALPPSEFCGPIDEPSRYHKMASEIVGIPGIVTVVSIKKHSVTIIKEKNFSKAEIEEKLRPILRKYLKAGAIAIEDR